MKSKSDQFGLHLIPHFKTPQSKIIGTWAQEIGIHEISVSSMKMARYLSDMGWDNIHIAFPVNIRDLDALNTLNETNSISIQLVNLATISFLTKSLKKEISFFIEIDAGYGRTGVKYDDIDLINAILDLADASGMMHFKGFYIHPGHSYYTKVSDVYSETLSAMKALKNKYIKRYPGLRIRCGDTPGSSIMQDFGVIDELGPGNFIFYDLMQVQIGSCTRNDIAIALAVPVVDVNYTANKILVHGGGVHLSKDFIIEKDGTKHFGEVVLLTDTGWKIPEHRSFVDKVSQEHGVIHASDYLMKRVEIGELIGVLPVHSCMTADCMRGYLTTDGQWVDHAEGVGINLAE